MSRPTITISRAWMELDSNTLCIQCGLLARRMSTRNYHKMKIAVAGFVALDLISDETGTPKAPLQPAAGGSACNIAIILRFLGVEPELIGELGKDLAGDI